jgi:hypothetical protein
MHLEEDRADMKYFDLAGDRGSTGGIGHRSAMAVAAVVTALLFIALSIATAETAVDKPTQVTEEWALFFDETLENAPESELMADGFNGITNSEHHLARTSSTVINGTYTETIIYFPIVFHNYPEPTEYYFDDFSNPASGWPVKDNTWNHQDCWKWYYNTSANTYNNDICDDRTDVKVSPLVRLPDGDYVISADARFGTSKDMWWTAYGILFDAKDDPNPSKPDLGDYYMLWVLWEGSGKHKWKILKDVPGDQEDVTSWKILDSSYYNYGGNGTAFNNWRIVRTSGRIAVYVNGHRLANVGEPRPTTNSQFLFGLYSSTYETSINRVAFDNYLVDYLNADARADVPYWTWDHKATGVVSSGEFELEHLLPSGGVYSGGNE